MNIEEKLRNEINELNKKLYQESSLDTDEAKNIMRIINEKTKELNGIILNG